MTDEAVGLLDRLGLTEYEATALQELLTLGRTTAPNLAQATGIPKARIYGVLDSLSDRGFIKIIPGRPKEYQPKSPEEILDRAEENRRQEFEGFVQELEAVRAAFLAEFRPRFERASEDITPTEELFHVVDVGQPSERETRQLYHEADDRVRIITKSFEYFDAVRPAFEDAIDRGIDVDALFLHPDLLEAENRPIQAEIVERIRSEFPTVDLRFSSEKLPWRGTVTDPSMDYETGRAIILVEEKDVPLHMRQAALTDNGSFVAGLQRYFELVWEHESEPPSALDDYS
ncbi:TrmB family transcriptional regulator [Halorientalis pallida]|uniref:TrmB family transcriptional regulator n=1 Tax=Halorientalis pallida TaxID=2479928 RepID=A0A498L2I5_9EURY|nr:helix-turn-helix domain-containing protein [Halorientalis pallida]RXK49094.1 TrmB family transcriptional regulator [Halorientalis pallida]